MNFRKTINLYGFLCMMFMLVLLVGMCVHQHTGNMIVSIVTAWFSSGVFTMVAIGASLIGGRRSYGR